MTETPATRPAPPTDDTRAPLRARSWPAALLVLFCLVAGIPTVVALTPDQGVTAFGQYLRVGARAPDLAPVGPAQIVQVGNTTLDVDRVRVWGPLRPQLTLGPVQRNAAATAVFEPGAAQRMGAQAVESVTRGFVDWYLLAGAGLLAFTLAASLGAAGLRTLLVLRRQSRSPGGHAPLPEILRYCVRAGRRMTVVAVAAVVLAWGVSGVLAWAGASDGLRSVASLSQLVGARQLTPDPVGPPVEGFDGAVIGDSRVSRLGGPPLPDGSAADVACGRSTDSLAAQLAALRGERVLNLACPSATVTAGLRGPQEQGGQQLPPQIGLLKQVRDLDYVVVAIGPNDVSWTDFLLYCYGVPDCADNLVQGEFDYRLAAFDNVWSDLLVDLNELPGDPQVVVMTSYEAFPPDAGCGDARGPQEYPGLDAAKIELLTERNDALNEVLTAGARAYGFAVADPPVRALCEPSADGLGPDLQGLGDPFPFHPTGVGSLRMAAGVSALLDRAP
ncbi:MAG: GDSL-type esterase/lipase family protein [Pseudonocardiales bacterium]|nr:GDSL-type esterase/lipase family protein [Pseudonocardiales bacterium]